MLSEVVSLAAGVLAPLVKTFDAMRSRRGLPVVSQARHRQGRCPSDGGQSGLAGAPYHWGPVRPVRRWLPIWSGDKVATWFWSAGGEQADRAAEVAALLREGGAPGGGGGLCDVKTMRWRHCCGLDPRYPLKGCLRRWGAGRRCDHGPHLDRWIRLRAVDGAWNLREPTWRTWICRRLWCFVDALGLRTPAQGNYAAANAFLTGWWAHRRRVGWPDCR